MLGFTYYLMLRLQNQKLTTLFFKNSAFTQYVTEVLGLSHLLFLKMQFSALEPQKKYSIYRSKSIFIICFLGQFVFVFFSFVCFVSASWSLYIKKMGSQVGINPNTSTEKQSDVFFTRYGTEPSSCLTCSICISYFSMPHAIITPLRNAAICNWRDNNDFINKIITPGI